MNDESIAIGPIGPADRAAVVEILQADLRDLGVERSPESILGVLDGAGGDGEDRALLWGARTADGLLAGVLFANIGWSFKHGGRSIWLEQLRVRPDARRRGVGRRLVEELLAWARREGVAGIDLESYQLNAPASVLYRSLGFRRLGRERFFIALEGGE